MVEYTTTPADVEMGPEERTVVFVEKGSSAGWLWKVFGALFLVALCSGAALLFVRQTNGPETPTQPGQTEALIEEDSAEKADPHTALRRLSSTAKAAIHLEGSYDDESEVPAKLEWRNGVGQAFAQGGFRLEGNKIVIPQTGLYFVYSQASFRVSCFESGKEGTATAPMPLSHRIWRESDSLGSSKSSLMSAVRSACQTAAQEESYRDGQGWYNTIYLGAVFQLNKGDELSTETNQLAELETEDGKTFFGVFAL